MDAELVLDRRAARAVAAAKGTVAIDKILRHHEKRDAFHALGRIGRAREHQVHDLLGEVVLAISDEDLLPGDAVMVALAHRPRLDEREIRTGLRLGEVHGAGPFAHDHLGDEGAFQLLRSTQRKCMHRALSEQRTERKAHICAGPHLVDRGRDELGQALPAPFGLERKRVPSAGGELAIRILEALGRGDLAVGPVRAFLVTGIV